MSPELAHRLATLSDHQRDLLAATIEALPDQGADLIEADVLAIIDALVAPTPMEVVRVLSSNERYRCRELYRRHGVDVLSLDELSQAVPWLADATELMRKVEAWRERPISYDPDD